MPEDSEILNIGGLKIKVVDKRPPIEDSVVVCGWHPFDERDLERKCSICDGKIFVSQQYHDMPPTRLICPLCFSLMGQIFGLPDDLRVSRESVNDVKKRKAYESSKG